MRIALSFIILHEKYAYDDRKDRNNDNPYIQDYTPESGEHCVRLASQSSEYRPLPTVEG